MKATLLTLLAMMSVAAAANTDPIDVTWTFTNLEKPNSTDPTTTNRPYTRSGISFVLQADATSYKLTSSMPEATLGKSISLDSITLPYLNSAYSNMWGIICNSSGTVIGISTSRAACASDGDLTFNYSNLELNTGERYGLVFFVSANVTTQTAMLNWISNNNWSVSGTNAHQNVKFTAVTSDYTTGELLSISDKNSNFSPSNTDDIFLPGISIVGHTTIAPIPEPTTGTLSLLALAGLCIRRRK